jgi:hypothetical protein
MAHVHLDNSLHLGKDQAMRSFLPLLLLLFTATKDKAQPSLLTPKEIEEGWINLFDGETTFGWKIKGQAKVEKGVLVLGGAQESKATTTTWFPNSEVEFTVAGRGRAFDFGGSVSIQSPTSFTLRIKAKQQAPKTYAVWFEAPAGSRVFIHKVKLRPLGLKPIFNGKDLTGWKEIKTKRTKSKFSVTDKGELHIQNGPGDLQTVGQWKDFVLQLDCFSNGKHLNSGVFFRCLPGQFWSGYEAQIRNQWQDDDRSKPVDYGTGGIYNRQPARKVVSSDNEWFTMTILAQGKHLAVWVNGYQTADFTDPRPLSNNARKGCKLEAGPISLQGHDPTTDLLFRRLRIAEVVQAATK